MTSRPKPHNRAEPLRAEQDSANEPDSGQVGGLAELVDAVAGRCTTAGARGALRAWIDAGEARPRGGHSLGTIYEGRVAAAGESHSRGTFYTPLPLAEALVAALETVGYSAGGARGGFRAVDPAAGCGAFLLAVVRQLGRSPSAAGVRKFITGSVFGVERDPAAAELARVALWLEAPSADWWPDDLRHNIVVGDALAGEAVRACWGGVPGGGETDSEFSWEDAFPEVLGRDGAGGFDVVVGNPPFLNQLETSTVRDRAAAARLRARFGGAVRGYADVSAAFLLLAAELLRPGGRAVMIQPQSLLAAKHAGPIRAALARVARLKGLWVGDTRVFAGASVFTCAPMLVREAGAAGGVTRPVALLSGPAVTPAGAAAWPEADAGGADATWSPLAAAARGVPHVRVRACGRIGDLAEVTADFRDQYYGLAGHVIEDADLPAVPAGEREERYPRLMTVGLIDLCRSRWGEAATRVHRRRWAAPRVDREAVMRTDLAGWLTSRARAKLLVATQTRVIEVMADAGGLLVPSTPVLSVLPRDAGDVWRLGAALASPVVVADAAWRFAGTALSVGAMKLSAAQARGMPLPAEERAWADGAECFRAATEATAEDARRAALMEMARAMIAAAEVTGDEAAALLAWWVERLWRGETARTRG